jgi:CHAT domain-containing protein
MRVGLGAILLTMVSMLGCGGGRILFNPYVKVVADQSPGGHLQDGELAEFWLALDQKRTAEFAAQLNRPWSPPQGDLGLDMVQGSEAAACSNSGSEVRQCLQQRGLTLVPDQQLSKFFSTPSHRRSEVDATTPTFRRMQDGISGGAGLVRFFVTGDEFEAVVLNRHGVWHYELGVQVDQVRDRVSRLLSLMRSIPLNPELLNSDGWEDDAGYLYDRLLRPMEQQLDRAESVAFILDDALLNLPMGMLLRKSDPLASRATGGGQFAFERYKIRYAVNVRQAIHDSKSRRSSAPRMLVVGNPSNEPLEAAGIFRPLPSAQEEAVLVSMLFPGSTLLEGPQATRRAVLSKLGSFDVIHLASHAKAMPDPKASFLVMSTDRSAGGLITVEDLLGTPLSAELVVLSACETAASVGGVAQGSLTSLATAILETGADAVVSTMWQVHSQATSEFMADFYQGYGEYSVATNLRNAQRSLLADEKYRHPYFWAPFVVYGLGS